MTGSTAQLSMPPIAAIKAAKKRCISMGAFHAWRPVFDMHPLAACMDNHTVCIDVELSETSPDWFAILCWILNMAKRINWFCDENKVVGDVAAQYWLERFLWRCDVVCQLDYLPS